VKVSYEVKELQLVRAICRVNNLCNELNIPELISVEASKTILEASRKRWNYEKADFLLSLAKPRTNRVQ